MTAVRVGQGRICKCKIVDPSFVLLKAFCARFGTLRIFVRSVQLIEWRYKCNRNLHNIFFGQLQDDQNPV